uniref:Uncharacterized protein n=1 Tax=Glossina pallidipes TaxID=7398 RepID=A0A1A9Z5M9_GLOPL
MTGLSLTHIQTIQWCLLPSTAKSPLAQNANLKPDFLTTGSINQLAAVTDNIKQRPHKTIASSLPVELIAEEVIKPFSVKLNSARKQTQRYVKINDKPQPLRLGVCYCLTPVAYY